MLRHIAYILCFVFAVASLQAQNTRTENPTRFTVRGTVVEQDTREPIPNVNIQINGGSYTTTDFLGEFRVEAKKGDELIIRHKDFETIYYTIQSNERIQVEVEPATQDVSSLNSKRNDEKLQFKNLIDSAETYLKKDAKKSIQFITNALELSNTKRQNAIAYEVLGDVYQFWKQYDLALSNYALSLQNSDTNAVRLKLAKTYWRNENYQESIQEYEAIPKKSLSNYQLVSLYEGLGDVYKSTNEFDKAIAAYNNGLSLAQKHLIAPKITDLNSKIAEAFSSKGQVAQAKGYYDKSLKLANTQNKKRAVEEKVKVADFQNSLNAFDAEINLRKQALEDMKSIETDSVPNNESALTPQKQKYKIGNAYAQQSDYGNAIQFLEQSIQEAENKADLIVQKDATRKLSEVYKSTGDFTKALKAYQSYVDVVDKLYRKREQEISQAARFGKELATKQNRITSLESDRELSESKYLLTIEQSKRQKIIIYSLISGLFLLLITAVFMYKYIRQQRYANNLLALKSLRSQMNPHFIFNALNSVNSFIASNDERTANTYLTDFSKLMRAVLENSEEDFIPLSKEIELLRLYTQLEHFRFQDKFDYRIHIDDHIAIDDFSIPPMLLQPYIENAVWHGLRYKTEKGLLQIDILQIKPNEITISIIDNGIGRNRSKALKTKHQEQQKSKGMGNIKKRVAILNAMYKDKVDVFVDDYTNTADCGTKVVVTLKKE